MLSLKDCFQPGSHSIVFFKTGFKYHAVDIFSFRMSFAHHIFFQFEGSKNNYLHMLCVTIKG